MADVPLVNNPMTAVADSIIGGTVTGGVAAPTRLKNNWSAAVAPTVNEDSGDGYAIGSRWIDTTADKEYVALDVTVGAAVWTETTSGGGGSVATDAIWDAAGDLAVGTGANTAARLAKGAAGAFLGSYNGVVGWNGGTSFPASPATGDVYYRSDLLMDGVWDGTRWLAKGPKQRWYFTSQNLLVPAASNFSLPGAVNEQDFDLYLYDLHVAWYVATTNDGTKYWTWSLSKNPGGSMGVSANTSAGSASTWTKTKTAINALIGASTVGVDMSLTMTSTPGSIYFGGFMTYRLVLT